jgi:hypothetical protein
MRALGSVLDRVLSENVPSFGTCNYCKHFMDLLKLIIKPSFVGFPQSWGL